jgi:hypothetical protein
MRVTLDAPMEEDGWGGTPPDHAVEELVPGTWGFFRAALKPPAQERQEAPAKALEQAVNCIRQRKPSVRVMSLMVK